MMYPSPVQSAWPEKILRQNFDRKGVKNHQNILGEPSLGFKEKQILINLDPHPLDIPVANSRARGQRSRENIESQLEDQFVI